MNDQAGSRDGGGAEIRALGDGIGAPENQGTIDGDGAVGGEASSCSIVSELERAGIDGRRARVGVRSGESQRAAAAVLRECTRATDDAGEGLGVRAAID